MLVVKKFGGTSVANKERIFNVAKRCIEDYKKGNQVVVVLSAMGKQTDVLLDMAKDINPKASRRELDMLLTTGEQTSVALMAMAMDSLGVPAVSLNAFQVAMHTTADYGNARLKKIDTERIKFELDNRRIVVITGFQGISKYDDLTTLGRGGSDTTAVALAGAMKADVCEIFTDVEGVYSTDPRVAKEAFKLEEVTYGEMLEMARLGAGVMQPRAVEMGFRYGVPIHVRSTFSNNTGTIIREDYTVESNKHVITGVADDTNTAKVALVGVENKPGIAAKVFKALAEKNVDVDMIVQSIRSVGEPKTDLIFTIALDDVVLAREVLKELQQTVDIEAVNIDENMAKVSIIGAGMLGQPGVAAQMFDILSKEGINIEIISTSEISISCLVAQNRVKDAVRVIHNGLLLNERG